MHRIVYIMGKSASGKDKIYRHLAGEKTLALRQIVLYTTRPRREKEAEGVAYHFVSDASLAALRESGKVIEERAYDTVHGVWRYATVDDGTIDLAAADYIAIGTLESYRKMKDYFGENALFPVYIEVDDGIRLERALKRERKQAEPKYRELCRRFLADCEDFSEEKLAEAGITRRFRNDGTLSETLAKIEGALGE